jgi:menaquinone-dependent protoporphyrinogen IX oxidase
VRSYIFQNHKLNLCEACAALAVKLKKEEMEGWREAQKHVEKFVEEL